MRFRLLAVLCVVIAIPVSMVQADETPEVPGPEAAALESNTLDRALEDARKREQERVDERATEQAVKEREASRSAYSSISDDEALELAKKSFPDFVDTQLWRPLDLAAGAQVKNFVGQSSARIDNPGAAPDSLIESSVPLRAKDDDGQRRLLDPTLETQTDGSSAPENAVVETTLPADLSEPVTLEDSEISVTPTDADSSSEGSEVAAKFFYPNVGTDTDFIAAPLPAGVELMLQLRSEEAAEHQLLDVEVPTGAKLELTDAGAQVVDGETLLAMLAPPIALDASGANVPASYSLDGEKLAVDVEHAKGDYLYPILVDPPLVDAQAFGGVYDPYAYQPLGWGQTGSGGTVFQVFWTGLYHQSAAGNYPAGSWGQWFWQAPGNSWIEQVEFQGAQLLSDGKGAWTAKGIWAPERGWNTGRIQAPAYGYSGPGPVETQVATHGYANTIHTVGQSGVPDGPGGDSEGTPGNYATTMHLVAGGQNNPGSFSFLGGMTTHLYEPEGEASKPSITSAAPQSDQTWRKDTEPGGEPAPHSIVPTLTDAGIGPWGAVLYGENIDPDGQNPDAKTLYEGCFVGGLDRRCGTAGVWEPEIGYELGEGRTVLTLVGYDPLYKQSGTQQWTELVDRSAPQLNISGTLKNAPAGELTDPSYTVQIQATDGSASEPAAERSGVASVEVLVDGVRAFFEEQGCAAGNCAMQRSWNYIPGNYAPGPHEVKVVATDQLGQRQSSVVRAGDDSVDVDVSSPEPQMQDAIEAPIADPALDVEEQTYPIDVAVVAEEIESPIADPLAITMLIDGVEVSQSVGGDCTQETCDFEDTIELDTVGLEPGEHEVTVIGEADPALTTPVASTSNEPIMSYATGGSATMMNASGGSGAARSLRNFKFNIPTDERAGAKPGWVMEGGQISDRASYGVNVAFGNLMVSQNDVTLPGLAGLGLGVSRHWNSFTDTKMDTSFGHGWSMGTGPDVRLKDADNNRAKFVGPTGYWARFTDGVTDQQGVVHYKAHRSGINGVLTREPNKEYKLLMVDSHTVYEFDTQGKLRHQVAADGKHKIDFEYKSGSRQLQFIRDTRGKELRFTYNGRGDVTQINDWAGRAWSYHYNSRGELDVYVDPAGKAVYYSYDNSSSKSPHRLTGVSDPNYIWTTFNYSDKGLRVRDVLRGASGPSGQWSHHFDYLTRGCAGDRALSTYTDPRGNETDYCFDEKGRVDITTDAEGFENHKGYKGNGNVAFSNDGDGRTDYTYTNDDASIEKVQGSGGETTEFDYENAGTNSKYLPTKLKDAQGNDWKYDYSGEQLTKVSVEEGGVYKATTEYGYQGGSGPADGLMEWSEDGKDQRTAYEQDSDGDLTKIRPPGTQAATTFNSDAYGRVTDVSDGNGHRTIVRDKLDRVLEVRLGDGSKTLTSYDPAGNPTATADYLNGATQRSRIMTHNERNMLESEVEYTGTIQNQAYYAYDGAGNLSQVVDEAGSTDYDYNKVNLVRSIREPGETDLFTFAYQSDYQLTSMTFPNGVKQDFTYRDDHLTQIEASKGGETITDLHYDYDKAEGQGTGLQNLRSGVYDDRTNTQTNYNYDHIGRLTAAITPDDPGKSYRYTYDAASNLTKMEAGTQTTNFNHNASNELTGEEGQPYNHNAAGDITKSPRYDMSFNARGQTKAVTPTGGPQISMGYMGDTQDSRFQSGSTQLSHNMLGLNWEKTGGQMTQYTRMIPMGLGRPAGDPYTSASYRGQVLGQKLPSGQRQYYLVDAIGSVVAVTDANGQIAKRYTYDPYGKLVDQSSHTIDNQMRFAGERADGLTGLYKIGTRYYDAKIGRWTQTDPIAQPFDAVNVSPYVYAGADPVNMVDPSGRAPTCRVIDGIERCHPSFDGQDAAEVGVGVMAIVAGTAVTAVATYGTYLCMGGSAGFATAECLKGGAVGATIGAAGISIGAYAISQAGNDDYAYMVLDER